MVGKELTAKDIKDKDIRKAVEPLLKKGWTLHKEGHGTRLYCPCSGGGCTTIPIGSTPRSPTTKARQITNAAGRCPKPKDSPQRSLTGGRD